MKKRILAIALSGSLLLSGCTAMLERSNESEQRHEDKPVTAEDASYVRVEDYRQLVSAVLYLVSQRAEEGVIRLYDYDGDVESDLSDACLEVAAQDPLGAYAVDYIKHEYTRVVSYYQATLSIRYRRTAAQMASVVKATGTSAIRLRVREALTDFAPEVVLRVAYFAEDRESIAQLVRQAYYDVPGQALGMPEVEVALYPDSGRERVLEIVLRYPDSPEELRRRSRALADRVAGLTDALARPGGEEGALQAVRLLAESARYDPQGGSTAYDALTGGGADSQGMALALALLSREMGVHCEVVEGTLRGEARMWNAFQLSARERRYFDPAGQAEGLSTAQELVEQGYDWPGAPEPAGEEPGAAQG